MREEDQSYILFNFCQIPSIFLTYSSKNILRNISQQIFIEYLLDVHYYAKY